jgi:hypothetical protein
MSFSVIIPALMLLAQGANDLSPAELSGILRMVAQQASAPGRIACRDLDITVALKKDGLSTDPRSPVAWASDASQARAFAEAGKFVVCGSEELLQAGGALAIVKRSGKTELILHLKHAGASGVQLSDALMKAARRL